MLMQKHIRHPGIFIEH